MRKKASNPTNVILLEEYSVEKEIAETQLNFLREASRNRLLSYEEIKIYDLLVKNLYLSKGEATVITQPATQIESPKEKADLLKIAEFTDVEKISDLLNIVEEPAKNDSGQDSNQ